jgi:hypothetical protein
VVQAQGDQGCGPGFWKQEQHFDSWVLYSPGQSFESLFGPVEPLRVKKKDQINGPTVEEPTLLQALNAPGGGINALARQAVAALLNAESPDVDYALSWLEVITYFQAAVGSTDPSVIETQKDDFEDLNELGCPLNGDEV